MSAYTCLDMPFCSTDLVALRQLYHITFAQCIEPKTAAQYTYSLQPVKLLTQQSNSQEALLRAESAREQEIAKNDELLLAEMTCGVLVPFAQIIQQITHFMSN